MINEQISSYRENKSQDISADSVSSLPQDRKSPRNNDLSVLFFGLIVPAAALISGWMMRSSPCFFLFDPIPTCGHLFIYSLIPIGNLCCQFSLSKHRTKSLPILGFLNGAALGASFFCTLMLMPFFPILIAGTVVLCIRWEWMIFAVMTEWFSPVSVFFAIMGIIPLLAFISAKRCRHHLKGRISESDRGKIPGTGTGIILTISLLIMLEMPLNLTLSGMELASSTQTEHQGIRLLRLFGDEDILLKMCYGKIRYSPSAFLHSMVSDSYPSDISALYYRVTGKPFNRTDPFGDTRFRPRNRDICLASESVGGKQKGLSLSASEIEGMIHSDAALSYLEWTLEFENTSETGQEARAQIQLFPGSTVSRLTLWIDGEEREALFAEKKKVIKAYRNLVSRKQKAVLVSDKGGGRIMLQCFPVRGKMKIRLGISSPLFLEKEDRARLDIPCFAEANFDIPETFRHSVQIESDQPVSVKNRQFKKTLSEQGLYAVQGSLTESELSERKFVIQAARSPDAVMTWCRDPAGSAAIWQSIETGKRICPSRIVFVIDGSREMREFIPKIADALPHLPRGTEFGITVASDTAEPLLMRVGTPETYRAAREQLKKTDCIGGQDNISALIRARNIAAEKKNSAMVWIHGVQPVLLQSPEILKQKFESPPEIRVFDIPVAKGPNRIIEASDFKGNIEPVCISGNVSRDLKRLFSEWKGTQKYYRFSRSRIKTDFGLSQDRESASHIARLWAYNEVLKQFASDENEQKEQAVRIAADYHIVTPATGALVLETEGRYRVASLKIEK